MVAMEPQYRACFLAALDDTDERHSVARLLRSERAQLAKQQMWACVLGMHLRAQLEQVLAAAQRDDAQRCAAVVTAAAVAPASPAREEPSTGTGTADSLRLAVVLTRSAHLEHMMSLFSSALRRPGEVEALSPTMLLPKMLDALAGEVRASAKSDGVEDTPTIEHVMHVLFRAHNFRGNHEHYEALSKWVWF